MQNPDSANSNPLICALDGALLKTDLKSEKLIHASKNALERILSSKLDLKRLQLERNESTGSKPSLPVNEKVLGFLQEQKSRGRVLILDSTEDPAAIDEMLSEHNIFDQIQSISTQTYPDNGYDYIGGVKTPQSIWDGADKRYSVGNTTPNADYTQHFSIPSIDFNTAFKAIRAYQWLKNLLVFVPIITAQQVNQPGAMANSVLMFICFSAVASFGYIFNDLLDLQSDRAHPVKRNRPFASGRLNARQGIALGVCLLAIAVFGCLLLPPACSVVLGSYLLLTMCYSLYLKTKLMIDVVSLGGLFTLRVIGGATAIQVELSFYLLSFSIFIFSSLGMVKRFAELHNLQSRNKLAAHGRGYRVEDMAPVRIIGISLGYMSVFIMGLYINSPVVTEYYNSPKYIWLLLPVLTYWLGRLWILANRGMVNEDPLLFTVKDGTSILVAAICAVILLAAN